MDKKNSVFNKNKTKITTNILSRALYSPFRSSKVKRILSNTGAKSITMRFNNLSNIRSRISRPYISDLNPLKVNLSRKSSTEIKISTDSFNDREDPANIIKTPSTIQECEPLNDDSIDESLFSYFHNEYHRIPAKTPFPSMITPTIKHRYQISMPNEIGPFRSETPKIPTRDKPKEVKLPVVENKHRPRENRDNKNRSPSPQEKKNKFKNDYFAKLRMGGLIRVKNKLY